MGTDKLKKALGLNTTQEMDACDESQLKAIIVEANQAMDTVKKELEANPKYRALKESLADVTQGKKDVDKRQKAKIQYALHLLEEKGKA